MKAKKKYTIIGISVFCSIYIALYFLTTDFKVTGAGGGLAGTEKVRYFNSVYHLIAFYPLYVTERVIRNKSLTRASYYFNCEFYDGNYKWDFLYGDGKYSSFWGLR